MAKKGGRLTDIVPSSATSAHDTLQKVISLYREKKNINIVVTGNTGAGKSTLIGSMLPNVLTKLKHGATSCKHDILEKYHAKLGDGSVTVYDTPGFCSLSSTKREILSSFKSYKRSSVLTL